jgi:hypothetical protein
MQALPSAVRNQLPMPLQRFKSSVRGWLCQLYYADPGLHYEVWNLGERRGLLEIGLHFESKNNTTNSALLAGFQGHMVEIKATLGSQWEAEQWDRGWTKVYETVPYEPFSPELLDAISGRLAKVMMVLTPILDDITRRSVIHPAANWQRK